MYEFEWDIKKSIYNESKHNVSFDEAVTVFGDPLPCILMMKNILLERTVGK